MIARDGTGSHTNEIENGLLLRADIHQMFDAYLLSIQPDKLTIEISFRVTDDYYRSLIGKKISSIRLFNLEYLKLHHRIFLLKQIQ